jgi:hypothetical protein
MDTLRKVICRLFMLAALCTQAVASGSSPFLPSAQLVGQGQFTRFGFSVYEARLWAPLGRYSQGEPFALSLTYSREIKMLNGAGLLNACCPMSLRATRLLGCINRGRGQHFFIVSGKPGKLATS